MIKSLAILIFTFAIVTSYATASRKHTNYSVLAIEYIGESDYRITPIVISDSEAGAEWYQRAVLKRRNLVLTDVHVVNASLLEKLIAEVQSSEGAARKEQAKSPKSEKTVLVTIITPQEKKNFLYDTESAISQLENLKYQCKGEGSLSEDLLYFQNQIRP